MLTDEDIKKIGEEVGKVVEQNVTPAIEELRGEINGMRSQMVTKEYLDDKLSDHHGDIVVLMRKEDHKVRELIDILRAKNILTQEDVKRLLQLEPFPILAL